jgi:hypothetical protein
MYIAFIKMEKSTTVSDVYKRLREYRESKEAEKKRLEEEVSF